MSGTSEELRAQRFAQDAGVAEAAGDLMGALQALDEALRLRNDWPPYLVSRGSVLRKLERYSESEEAIGRALQVSPTASYAWTEMGLLYQEQSMYKQAAYYLEKSASLRPNHSTLTLLAATELMFDPNAALVHAETALQLNGSWEEAVQVRNRAQALLDDMRHGRTNSE